MRPLFAILFTLLIFFTVFQAIGEEKKETDKPPYYLTDAELDKKLGVNEKTDAPKDYVWAVYFHRAPGCDTCQLMSKHVFATVNERLSDNVKEKQIVLRYKNFEDKKNAALVKKLGIKSPSLAVVEIKDGKLTKAKLADKIWSHAAEKKKFMDYVEKEIRTYCPESKEEQK